MTYPTKEELLQLISELAQNDNPYFSQKMVLASGETDLALPGLVWLGTNSPRPSPRPYWRVFQNPTVTRETPSRSEVLIWLGQLLSGQVGRDITTRILEAIVNEDETILDDIAALDRFQLPTTQC